MPTQISLLVYKGVPVDFSQYRHTALHVLHSEDEYDWLHVVGAHPFFNFQKDPQNPIPESPVAWIPVCTAPDSITRAMIHFACMSTPVRNGNGDRDWNCQNWVGEALSGLVDIGCVTKQERSAAIGKMVEIILDAELEDVSAFLGCVLRMDTHAILLVLLRMECFSLSDFVHFLVASASTVNMPQHSMEDNLLGILHGDILWIFVIIHVHSFIFHNTYALIRMSFQDQLYKCHHRRHIRPYLEPEILLPNLGLF